MLVEDSIISIINRKLFFSIRVFCIKYVKTCRFLTLKSRMNVEYGIFVLFLALRYTEFFFYRNKEDSLFWLLRVKIEEKWNSLFDSHAIKYFFLIFILFWIDNFRQEKRNKQKKSFRLQEKKLFTCVSSFHDLWTKTCNFLVDTQHLFTFWQHFFSLILFSVNVFSCFLTLSDRISIRKSFYYLFEFSYYLF